MFFKEVLMRVIASLRSALSSQYPRMTIWKVAPYSA